LLRLCNSVLDVQAFLLLRVEKVKMYHTAEIRTAASSAVIVQRKACVTRTVVCSRQIVAQLLTIMFFSTTFINV